MGLFRRLISNDFRQLKGKADVETLRSGRAYRLFSKVVDYGSFFHGKLNITMDDGQAFANIKIPEDQSHRDQSTVLHLCDAMVIDAYVQTVGLLINSSDAVASTDVLIATSFDSVSLTKSIRLDSSKTWDVYTKYEITSERHAIGDVFVLTSGGMLVTTIIGCRFIKLPRALFIKVLDSANPHHSLQKPSVVPLSQLAHTPSTESSQSFLGLDSASITSFSDSPTSSTTPPTETDQYHELALREIISEYTGISCSEISEDAVVADLGVDSLTAVEMAEELAARSGKVVVVKDIAIITFNGLLKLLSSGSSSSPNRDHGHPDREKPIQSVLAEPSSKTQSGSEAKQYQALCDILEEFSGAPQSAIEQRKTIGELGIDSLSMVELKEQIENTFHVRITDDQFTLDSTALDVMKLLGITIPSARASSKGVEVAIDTSTHTSPLQDGASVHQTQSFSASFRSSGEALMQTERKFHQAATKHGFIDYWSTVAPIQNKLSAFYIWEAYGALTTGGTAITPGQLIGLIPCLPKYSRLAERFLNILETDTPTWTRLLPQRMQALRRILTYSIRSTHRRLAAV